VASNQHASDDDLELFEFDKLDDAKTLVIATHLSECGGCADRLAILMVFIRVLRSGVVKGGYEVAMRAEEFRPKR
jgi:hypothetical protein